MKLHDAAWPGLAVLIISVVIMLPERADGGSDPSRPPPTRISLAESSLAEIGQAFRAVERANGYREILKVIERYQGILGSPAAVSLADQLLQCQDLNDNQRGVLMLERLLSTDCRQFGPTAAARRLSIRLMAGSAMLVDSPEQFALVMDKFSDLASEMNEQLVMEALNTPGHAWPESLFPLMVQLGRDWPRYGALTAATRLAETANPVGHSSADTDSSQPKGTWEDRVGDKMIEMGYPIPDGLNQ